MAAGSATEAQSALGVLGASAIEERFRRTIQCRRLASTYLFVGPEGVGKRLFARRLARALLCQSPQELRACGECDSCRLNAAGTHPDLLQVSKPEGRAKLPLELFLGKPDARLQSGLCHDLALRPLIATRRVAVIDDADDFSIESANCLLKTLEEPPPHSVIFLIGTSLARQLPTIRSRSQVIRFSPLSEEEVAEILSSPPHSFSEEEAQMLATYSEGSPAKALASRNEGLQPAVQSVMECVAAPRLDSVRLTRLLDEAAKEAGSEAAARRARLRELISALICHYRAELRECDASVARSDHLLAALDVCLEAEAALQRNVNQSALVQWIGSSLGRLE